MKWAFSPAAVAASTLIVAMIGVPAPVAAEEDRPAAPPPPPPPPATADERLERIEAELERTKAELEAVKKEQADARDRAAAEKKTEGGGAAAAGKAAPSAADLGPGFVKKFGEDVVVTFKDGFDVLYLDPNRPEGAKPEDSVLHKFGVHGRFQLDFRGFLESDYPTDERFVPRRIRIAAQGFFFKYYEYIVEYDLGTFAAGLRDAWLNFHYIDEVQLRVGQHKVPFSREQLISSRFLPFVERAFFNVATAPIQFDLGASIHGKVGPVEYAVGVYNGRGFGAGDDNEDKDFAGRLAFAPFKWEKEGPYTFSVAVNATYGIQDTIPADFTTYAGTPYLDFPGSAANVRQNGHRCRAGGDAAITFGPGYLIGEYLYMRLEDLQRIAVEESGKVSSFWLGAVFFLTGELVEPNRRVYPNQSFDPFTGGTGAFAVAARFDQLHVDHTLISRAIATGTDQVDAVTLGFRWFMNPWVKLETDFYKAWFDDRVNDEKDEWGVNVRFALEY
jgi:phosphate-selective porin